MPTRRDVDGRRTICVVVISFAVAARLSRILRACADDADQVLVACRITRLPGAATDEFSDSSPVDDASTAMNWSSGSGTVRRSATRASPMGESLRATPAIARRGSWRQSWRAIRASPAALKPTFDGDGTAMSHASKVRQM